MRCAACGARNTERAGWCTQCYEPLGPPGDRPLPASRSAGGLPTRDVPGVGAGSGGGQRDVRERDGEVEWRCPRCGSWSGLVATDCRTCGGPRSGFGSDPPASRREAPDAWVLVAASLPVPGLGHLLAGRSGTGVARSLLWLLWVVPGWATARGAGGVVAALPGMVLLAGAGTLWVATLVDVVRIARRDDREVLTARALLWLVGAVVGGLVLAVVVAALAVR